MLVRVRGAAPVFTVVACQTCTGCRDTLPGLSEFSCTLRQWALGSGPERLKSLVHDLSFILVARRVLFLAVTLCRVHLPPPITPQRFTVMQPGQSQAGAAAPKKGEGKKLTK